MKAIFEFNLPEDQNEYEVMSQALKTQRFLWDFSQELRNWQKYGNDFKDSDDALNKMRDKFYYLLNEYQVNIDL